MSRELKIQEFNDKQVRTIWDDEEQKYYFSVTDVVEVLTEQPNARGATVYWAVLKKRLKEEGANELITNCKQLKLPASDGKNRATDVADIEQLLRIIQSVPSKKAEPLKQWLVRDNMTNLELALNTLAEAATTEFSKQYNPKGVDANKKVAKKGGDAARAARENIEKGLGRSIISPNKASDYIKPIEEGKAQELPFDEDNK